MLALQKALSGQHLENLGLLLKGEQPISGSKFKQKAVV
jgi:hypothetical protein